MKNIKILVLTSLVFFFLSCRHDIAKETDLQIEILNKEIVSRGNQIIPLMQMTRFDNFMYDSIPVNKIDLRIKNNGHIPYAFFLKHEFDSEMSKSNNIKFEVYNKDELLPALFTGYGSAETMASFSVRKRLNEHKTDTLMFELQRKYRKGKPDLDRIKFRREFQYVVIHPGESKLLTYYRTLPLFEDNFFGYYIYNFSQDQDHFVQVSISNDTVALKKNLSTNQLKEINENGYALFHGTIHSQKVPIKFQQW